MEQDTLLQKALKTKVKRKSVFHFTDEEYELYKAWANDEITTRQALSATGAKSINSIVYNIAKAFRRYIKENPPKK